MGVLVKEELHDKVVEDRRVSDIGMSLSIFFEGRVVRVASHMLHKVENRRKKKIF